MLQIKRIHINFEIENISNVLQKVNVNDPICWKGGSIILEILKRRCMKFPLFPQSSEGTHSHTQRDTHTEDKQRKLLDLKNSCASSWLPSPIWQLILRMCERILLGDSGPPLSVNIVTCCSSSHMRHQSLAQPNMHVMDKWSYTWAQTKISSNLNAWLTKREHKEVRLQVLECDLRSKKTVRGFVQVKHCNTALA